MDNTTLLPPKVGTTKERIGQQKQSSKAKYVAGGVGYRIDNYPGERSKKIRQNRYVKGV